MNGWVDGWLTIFQLFRDGSSWVYVSCSRTQRSDGDEARTNPRPLGLRWIDRWMAIEIDGWMDR